MFENFIRDNNLKNVNKSNAICFLVVLLFILLAIIYKIYCISKTLSKIDEQESFDEGKFRHMESFYNYKEMIYKICLLLILFYCGDEFHSILLTDSNQSDKEIVTAMSYLYGYDFFAWFFITNIRCRLHFIEFLGDVSGLFLASVLCGYICKFFRRQFFKMFYWFFENYDLSGILVMNFIFLFIISLKCHNYINYLNIFLYRSVPINQLSESYHDMNELPHY